MAILAHKDELQIYTINSSLTVSLNLNIECQMLNKEKIKENVLNNHDKVSLLVDSD